VTVRILLLEDNVALARATGLVLERAAGATVTVAGSLGAATALLDDTTFDLVIADVTLPDGDGSDWGRQTRRDRGIPVVLMTAAANPEQLGIGLDGVLQKPVGLDDLLAAVTRLTDTS
jgi:DNA-binding response OmpR family regulator